jgi:hypothetical protein
MSPREVKAKFVEPMLLLPAESLPQGPRWTYQLKLDGFRALAIKTGGEVRLRSRSSAIHNCYIIGSYVHHPDPCTFLAACVDR